MSTQLQQKVIEFLTVNEFVCHVETSGNEFFQLWERIFTHGSGYNIRAKKFQIQVCSSESLYTLDILFYEFMFNGERKLMSETQIDETSDLAFIFSNAFYHHYEEIKYNFYNSVIQPEYDYDMY